MGKFLETFYLPRLEPGRNRKQKDQLLVTNQKHPQNHKVQDQIALQVNSTKHLEELASEFSNYSKQLRGKNASLNSFYKASIPLILKADYCYC